MWWAWQEDDLLARIFMERRKKGGVVVRSAKDKYGQMMIKRARPAALRVQSGRTAVDWHGHASSEHAPRDSLVSEMPPDSTTNHNSCTNPTLIRDNTTTVNPSRRGACISSDCYKEPTERTHPYLLAFQQIRPHFTRSARLLFPYRHICPFDRQGSRESVSDLSDNCSH